MGKGDKKPKVKCPNGHTVKRKDVFCAKCGSALPGASADPPNEAGREPSNDVEPSEDSPGKEDLEATTGVGIGTVVSSSGVPDSSMIAISPRGVRLSSVASDPPTQIDDIKSKQRIGILLMLGLAAFILVLVIKNEVWPSKTTSQSSSVSLTPVQRNCEFPAAIYTSQLLDDEAASNSSAIDSDLTGAMARFGQSSATFQAIRDAFAQTSTVIYQQGEKAAVIKAGHIIKADCTGTSFSSSGSSGSSSSASSGGGSISSSGTTIPDSTPSTSAAPATTLPPTTQPVEPPTTAYIPPTTIPMVSFGPNAIPGMTVEAAESTLNGLGFQTVVQHVDPSQCAGIHVDRVQEVAQPGSTYEDTGTYFYGQAPQGSTIALWVCQ